jgi:hypothetical protein
VSDLCGEWSGVREDVTTGEIHAGRIWCKSWKCEHCAPIRRKQLQAQAASGSPTTLITLTSPYGCTETPDEAARRLVNAWRLTLQAGQREGVFPRLQYIAIFEETRKGWPHLHILTRAPYIPQSWLSENMRKFGDAPIVDIRRVYNARHAARYVAKYVSKAPKRYNGCKRYWRTHGYDLNPRTVERLDPTASVGWLSRNDVHTLAYVLEKSHYVVQWEGDNSLTALPTRGRIYRRPASRPPTGPPPRTRVKPI